MIYPSPSAMLSLLALDLGDRSAVDAGNLTVVIEDGHGNGYGSVVLSPNSLEDLEARGWVNTDGDDLRVTERGAYWANRWAKQVLRIKKVPS